MRFQSEDRFLPVEKKRYRLRSIFWRAFLATLAVLVILFALFWILTGPPMPLNPRL